MESVEQPPVVVLYIHICVSTWWDGTVIDVSPLGGIVQP